jgi:aspartyl-tRNA(Asn)/glutamyl-tRNA(Gln) amidotransferase subunit C
MAVTPEDVRHVARLARLHLSPEEVERFTLQLNGILSHMEELSAAGAEEASPEPATAWDAPLRDDHAAPDALAHGPHALAPAWQGGFFTVPRLAALDSSRLGEGEAE